MTCPEVPERTQMQGEGAMFPPLHHTAVTSVPRGRGQGERGPGNTEGSAEEVRANNPVLWSPQPELIWYLRQVRKSSCENPLSVKCLEQCLAHSKHSINELCHSNQASQVALDPPANAGDIRDASSIPGSG